MEKMEDTQAVASDKSKLAASNAVREILRVALGKKMAAEDRANTERVAVDRARTHLDQLSAKIARLSSDRDDAISQGGSNLAARFRVSESTIGNAAQVDHDATPWALIERDAAQVALRQLIESSSQADQDVALADALVGSAIRQIKTIERDALVTRILDLKRDVNRFGRHVLVLTGELPGSPEVVAALAADKPHAVHAEGERDAWHQFEQRLRMDHQATFEMHATNQTEEGQV